MSDAAPLPDPEAMVVYLLLLDRDGRRMLVREDSGLAPSLRTAAVFYPEVEELVGRAREEIGLEVAILRCLEEGDANEGRPRLYSAVCVSEEDRPRAGFGWTALDEPKFGKDATERLIRMARTGGGAAVVLYPARLAGSVGLAYALASEGAGVGRGECSADG